MIWEYWNLIAFTLKVIFNILFSFGLLNCKSPKEISDERKTHFTPSRYTFIIWFIIYGFQAVFVIGSFYETNPFVNSIGIVYVFLCVFNILWLFAFGYERYNLSSILIIGMLASLIIIYIIMGIGFILPGFTGLGSPVITWFNFVPFSIYLGWVTVATVANHFVATFTKDKQDEEEAFLWLVYLTLPTSLLIWYRGDFVFALPVIWGAFGILINNFSEGKIRQGVFINVTIVIIVTIARFVTLLF